MITVQLKQYPDLLKVIRAAFPSYKKQTAFVSVFTGATINSYWDGGSRSYFSVVELATLKTKSLPSKTHPWFDVARAGMASQENADVEVDHVGNVRLKRLPEGLVLVEGGTFMGKTATCHLRVPAENMPKLLPGVSQ